MSGQSVELNGNNTPNTSGGSTDIDWKGLQNINLQQSQNNRPSNIYGASGNWDQQGLEAARQDYYARRMCQSQQYSGSANRGSSCGR